MERDNFFENKRLHDAMKKRHEEKISQSSRKRLKEIVEKRIRTTMIGALAELERSSFGKLFGYDKTNLTEEERKWKIIWDEIRTNILNQGNNQLREAVRDLEQFEAKFKPYRTEFIVKRENNRE